jgi:DNA-binding CsgD family transcriptional regulator
MLQFRDERDASVWPLGSLPPQCEQQLDAARLTKRERQIVCYVVRGMTNRQIARQCCITEQTVKDHLKHVYRKMAVSRRAALVAWLVIGP